MAEAIAGTTSAGETAAGKTAFLLLLATIVWTTLGYGTVHQPLIALFYAVIALAAVLWSVDALLSGNLRIDRTSLQIPLAATVLYGLVQVLPFGVYEAGGVTEIPRTISLAPYWTKLAVAQFAALLLFFSLLLSLTTSVKRISRIVVLVTGFGFAFAFFSILQSVLSPERIYGIYEVKFAVPFGSFVNRHTFAAFMEMSICLPLGLVFAGAIEKDKKLLYLTAIGLMGVALLLSGSRGGLVSIIAATVFLVFMTVDSKGTRGILVKVSMAVLLIGVFIAGAVLIGGESSLTRIAETAVARDISTSRFQIWSATLEVIRQNFPFGAGFGAFSYAYTQFDPSSGFERVEQAHNDYLQVLADAGVIGALIGLYFLYRLFRIGFASVKVENRYRRGVALGAFAGCVAVLVHSAFDFVLHITSVSILFLTMMTLVVVSGRHYTDEIRIGPEGRRGKRQKATVTSLEERRR